MLIRERERKREGLDAELNNLEYKGRRIFLFDKFCLGSFKTKKSNKCK